MQRGVKELLQQSGCDSVVLAQTMERPDSSFAYFTGLRKVTGYFLITENQQTLYVSPLEYGTAKQQSSVRDLRMMGKDTLATLQPKLGKHVGMNLDYLSVNGLARIKQHMRQKEIHDVAAVLRKIRMVKRKDELDCIREACKITDKIFQKTFRDARSVRTEPAMKQMIEEEMLAHGVTPSFDVIVASGKNSAHPHHFSENIKLKGMTILDIGVRFKNYCSDLTRTIFFGQPTRKELEVYHLVKSVQETCVRMVKEGEHFSVLHRYASQKIGSQMIHRIGHGLGIDVHEDPYPGKEKGDDTLKEGMVITIEPGMYLDGKFGVRIEDDVIVGKEKSTVLSKTGRELLVVS